MKRTGREKIWQRPAVVCAALVAAIWCHAAFADGKIVVAGYSDVVFQCLSAPFDCMQQFTLVRYEIDGTLDKSFGAQNSGTVTSLPGTLFGLLQQPDGRLVGAGFSSGAFALVRYLD